MAGSGEKKDRTGPGDLGIDLGDGDEKQAFKWLVACLLFGTRIKQELAADAFRALDGEGLTTPRKLAEADWQRLVDLLGESSYKRYDESKARELIQLGQDTLDRYDGHLARHSCSRDDQEGAVVAAAGVQGHRADGGEDLPAGAGLGLDHLKAPGT